MSDPRFLRVDFAPGGDARVAHAPAVHLSLASWPVSIVFVPAVRASSGCVAGCACPPENEPHRSSGSSANGWPASAWSVAVTHSSFELCSAPCKARRFAPPTRVVRAWPSGLDGACAQLAGRQLRDVPYVRFQWTPDEPCVRKSPAGAFIELQATPSATAQPPRARRLFDR